MSSERHTVVRRSSRGRLELRLDEVRRHRDLLWLLVWRNTIVLYKQTVAGIGWAVIRPVVSMVVLSIIFGRLARLPSEGVPYPIFVYVALLPWGYFSGALNGISNSLVGSTQLLSKVYFPRLVLPLASLLSGLVDFLVSFLVLVGLMCWYHESIDITWGVLLLPFFMLMAMLTALAVGVWLTSFMVRYRDVRHLLPFLTQIWMYLTPVAYTPTLVPERWRAVYALNPMVGVINGFRWALMGKTAPDWTGIAIGGVVVVLLLVGGLYHFRSTERTLADII